MLFLAIISLYTIVENDDTIGECGVIHHDNRINAQRSNEINYIVSDKIYGKLLEIFNLNDYTQLFGILNNEDNIKIIKEKFVLN